ncbi:MAG: S8 family serine peptidase, partial [Bacteroidales bacterium]|nr:S8 family serine peptidase [Bacteroidales bacterium]
MKKQILVAILCLATGLAIAQQKSQRDNVRITFSPDKVSATTAMLYYGLKTDNPRLLKDITFVNAGGAKSVVGFVVVADSNVSKLAEYGIAINGNKNGWIKTATFPLNTFVSFVESGLANYINIGSKATPQMDSSRYYTNADAVQHGGGSGVTLPRGYCGKNVVVGIVDIGFDFTHRNFYDSTETTFRIKRLWDQNDSTGTMPQGYSYGSEYTTPQAIQARLYSHNYHSHGSHVAGIAGGGGTTDTSVSKFKGMAPESDLVFVATSGSSSMLYEGVEYIADYAQSVGKPCVINLSWGSQTGSHDGKDWF